MKRLALLALLVALAVPAAAQQRAGNYTYKYDVASATATYCALLGRNGTPWFDPIFVQTPIETSGSSTTVTAVTAGSNPFSNLVAGDVLIVARDNANQDVRVITAKATADQVTVDTAVDWSDEFPFSWLDNTCGTTTAEGWISVSSYHTVQMTVQYEAGDLDTLDVAFYCKEMGLGASAIRVYPGPTSDCGDGTLSGTFCTFATPGQGLSLKIPHNAFAQCRVALMYGSTDGGTREQVTTTIAAVE